MSFSFTGEVVKSVRNDQCGDWRIDPGFPVRAMTLDLGNHDFNALLLIHELVEALSCKRDHVRDEEVCAFDAAYKGDGEPGDEENAPYHRQHKLATLVETNIALAWGIDLIAYNKAIDDAVCGKRAKPVIKQCFFFTGGACGREKTLSKCSLTTCPMLCDGIKDEVKSL